MSSNTEYFHNTAVRQFKCRFKKPQTSLAVLTRLGSNQIFLFFLVCPFYLKRCACCARGPGYLRLGDWYSWDSSAWLVFWLGLFANLTVIGSVAPGGFWQFRPLMASSASTRRSKRMKPTPLETPEESTLTLHQLYTVFLFTAMKTLSYNYLQQELHWHGLNTNLRVKTLCLLK